MKEQRRRAKVSNNVRTPAFSTIRFIRFGQFCLAGISFELKFLFELEFLFCVSYCRGLIDDVSVCMFINL